VSSRKPPALATWLLHRFRLPETNPPLAGDLLEEFRSGRSRAWYWHQTLVAIATHLCHNARTSRGRLTSILAAWLFQAMLVYTLWHFHLPPQVRPLYLVLASIVTVSHALMVVLVLGESGVKKLRSALGRLAYLSLLPFLEAAYSLRVRRSGLRTDPVKDAIDLALTFWVSQIRCFGSYFLIALCASIPRDVLLVFELLLLVDCMISEIVCPRPNAL
jgi:hypothetical protein